MVGWSVARDGDCSHCHCWASWEGATLLLCEHTWPPKQSTVTRHCTQQTQSVWSENRTTREVYLLNVALSGQQSWVVRKSIETLWKWRMEAGHANKCFPLQEAKGKRKKWVVAKGSLIGNGIKIFYTSVCLTCPGVRKRDLSFFFFLVTELRKSSTCLWQFFIIRRITSNFWLERIFKRSSSSNAKACEPKYCSRNSGPAGLAFHSQEANTL